MSVVNGIFSFAGLEEFNSFNRRNLIHREELQNHRGKSGTRISHPFLGVQNQPQYQSSEQYCR